MASGKASGQDYVAEMMPRALLGWLGVLYGGGLVAWGAVNAYTYDILDDPVCRQFGDTSQACMHHYMGWTYDMSHMMDTVGYFSVGALVLGTSIYFLIKAWRKSRQV